ncbi:MAG: endonuclease V [Bacteroidetes bacterium]|nr:MAG: endonuclease V [Bacteroidota bacterium]
MPVKLHAPHPWEVSPAEAVAIQRGLAGRVRIEPLVRPPETLAGIDVSVRGREVQAAIVVLTYPALEVCDEAVWRGLVAFPYVAGLLSFREIPAILPALEGLRVWPDVFVTDSQGIAHPRRMGLAAHLGVLLDHPTFGVAKTRLCGTHDEPGPEKGAVAWLRDGEEVIGAVVRTRTGVRPVYVSIGHRITLPEAVALTLASAPRFRLPEPTRRAHHLSRRHFAGTTAR